MDCGLSSLIAETIVDEQIYIPLKGIGIPKRYFFDNDSVLGSKEAIHRNAEIDLENVIKEVKKFIA